MRPVSWTLRIFLAALIFPLALSAEQAKTPADYVNPLIGTARARWIFFSSACRPFGLVNLSPDTVPGRDWGGGYIWGPDKIKAVSHLHGWQLGGVSVMAMTGAMRGPLGPEVYGSSFRHAQEVVRPGYHRFFLDDYQVNVELTSTDRVGLHRYAFPATDAAYLVFDLSTGLGPSSMTSMKVTRVSDTEIEGWVVNGPTRRRPKPVTVFFVAETNKPFAEFGGWEGKARKTGDEISGRGGAYLRFTTEEGEAILLKVAISYCSIDNARLNLESELPGWDFDQVVADSKNVWNDWLGRIAVEGGSENQRIRFFTDLFHSLLGRRTLSDVDGSYPDNTGDTFQVRKGTVGDDGQPLHRHYNFDAMWGAQWSISLVWSLAYPEVMSGFVNTMVDMYNNGGLIPRGPAGGNYTFVMTGASSTPFIVAAWQKGIRDFDVEAAYEGMRKNHFPGGMMSHAGYEHNSERGGGIEHYIKRGYVPEGRVANAYHVSGAGQTLEYAYQDWCLAQMAAGLSKDQDHEMFMKRASNYRNIFDAKSGLMRPRTLLGTWLWPFNPRSRVGWVEGNALQYTWFVPHDVQGLSELLGGREAFVERLNRDFEEAEPYRFTAGEGGYNGAINYGNQPGTQTAHLFNYAGAPWLSQKWVRKVRRGAFGGVTPEDGYLGDEDQGLMGSLGVLMSIGLFDVKGGCDSPPTWQLTSPEFDRVVIKLDPAYYPGGEFVIIAHNQGPDNLYIQSAALNGKPIGRPWIYHSDVTAGGALELTLGPEPNRSWGARPEDSPPSMTAVH